MNNEESRLRTFSKWPSDAAVDPARIAKAGFFYTGQGLEVQCFSCGGKITEWNYGDQVMAKHRRLDPNCPFVIDPSCSGNVPKLNSSTAQLPPAPTSAQTPVDPLTYRTESARLESYTNWSSEVVSAENLAKAGFYSLQIDDKVKCAFCNGIAGFWERGDDPKTEHRRHFPYCSFVQANFNQDEIESPNSKKVSVDNFQELGIQAHRGPRQSRYSTLESRLRTFDNWPVDLIQTPDMLAAAGFYYVGTGDQVRCFHCDGGLRHWDPEDEPWIEHAKWFPACAYVRLIKGQDFIQSCNPQELPHNNPTRSVSDQDVQNYMNTPAAIAALNIGLPVGRVKQAIRQKIEETGSSYSSADALIEAALSLQLEDSDSPDSEEIRIVPNVLQNDNKPIPKKQVAEKPQSTQNLSLEEENRQLKEARLCKVCMDNEIGVVFLPCGHLTTCVNCAPSLKNCPVCRSVIKGTVRTFLS